MFDSASSPAPPADVYKRAAQIASDAALRIAANLDSPDAGAAAISAAADLLATLAATWEGRSGGPLTRAAELFDRAAYQVAPTVPARADTAGYSLRAVARLLAATRIPGATCAERELQASLRLVSAIAGVADAVVAVRVAHQRLQKADAARAAAGHLRAYRPPHAHTPAAYRPPTPGIDPTEEVQQPNRRRR